MKHLVSFGLSMMFGTGIKNGEFKNGRYDKLHEISTQEGQAEALFKAFAEYVRDYPFDDIMHKIIDLGTGEFALIGVHHSVDSFIDIMNRDNRVSDMMRQFVEPYEDGESFHSFSGPVVNFNDYL